LRKKNVLLFIFCLISINYSQTHLPSFFSDNMVLQQNENVSIWGSDNPNVNITVSTNWGWGVQSTTKSDENGKWKIKIMTPSAGGPYTIMINGSNEIKLNNIMIGEVWLCSGQSNMEMPVRGFPNSPVNGSNEVILNSKNSNIRLFHTNRAASLTPMEDVNGKWTEAEPKTVAYFSAVAYFFGKKLNDVIDVPIGLIVSSWGGANAETWTDAQTLSQFNEIELPTELPKYNSRQQSPTLLYNGMINPFVGFNIKGVIWYQGESNRHRPEQYKKLFPEMIKGWRKNWGQGDFPFYFVQIAPYYYKTGVNSTFIRESQLYAMQTVVYTGMAVATDIGECDQIHPAEKEKIGNRLAYWALAKDYGIEGVAFSGPVYKSMEVTEDNKITLTFDYAERGLTTFKQELKGFQIAGEDKVFYKALTKIKRNGIVFVWSDKVPNPVAVRYAFDNCVDANLFNVAGLPASSFRTDNWDKVKKSE